MDTRSISMAAARLNVSQPALTKALQSLEEGIGARVFDRGAGGISPTPYALAILSHAGEINSGLSKIEREIALLKNNDADRLVIGAGMFATDLWLGPALAKMAMAQPRLRVEVLQLDWKFMMEMLREQRIDIGMASIAHASMNPFYKTIAISTVKLHFVCRMDHPLNRGGDPTLDDLRRYPYVGSVMPKIAADHFQGNAGNLGQIDHLDGFLTPAIEIANMAVTLKIVAETDAIAVCSLPLFAAQMEKEKVVALGRKHTPWLASTNGFMYLRDRPLSGVAKDLIEAVKKIASEIPLTDAAE